MKSIILSLPIFCIIASCNNSDISKLANQEELSVTTQQEVSTDTGNDSEISEDCPESSHCTPNNQEIFVLDSFEKPKHASRDLWKTSLSRTIFKDASTFFIVKGNLCLLVGEAQRLEPILIEHPSANEYPSDVYYDAITDLTMENCNKTLYAILDIKESYIKNGLNIEIKHLPISAPTTPTIPLFIQLEPYAFNIGVNRGSYVENHKGALSALELLHDHRIQPIKSWISSNSPIDKDPLSFMNYVGKFKNGPTNIPEGRSANLYAKYSSRPWFYVVDEPEEALADQIQNKLNELKIGHPSVRRMITTSNRYPVRGIDIYCPVMEQLDNREEYSGEVWSYVSCMSHGCGENRAYLDDPKVFTTESHSRSGAPDLTIDAPSSDIFAFFLIGRHLNLGALLYYDSITQWSLISKGINIYKDMYNFGGNGDGTILYPDFKRKRAFPSLRLKLLREASLLADAAKLGNYGLSSYIFSTTSWYISPNIRDEIYSHLKYKLKDL
ncbi:MAG: hypothetical protein COV57_02530 [Candidatus Liptonbacteria bacterium CG11_big_fil_rev_8_21_14_0_20_35_14]|uniref:Uncharacterized protein n=1 Tax=Candidatus Liptonbacteria bacterium CG11_big_fil_rev_8_21_14_0_20_35_14 TaxID=1974634 RepID=A0A2H0N7A9_9BACT|nr:MAG: hypothetical protein COV57_02530 [Candidatus Liptonbacteria bacterium CG11_big_fil_rev_8_21_14_0_20_35_14]